MSEFNLTSKSFHSEENVPHHFIYNGIGCDGDNISPSLEWKGAPSETKSFAVTVFDPDAPRKEGWWHWSVVNIPAGITEIPEGASNTKTLPDGALELLTDYKDKSYGGPCPPKGTTHRYVFTVYALDTEELEISKDSSASEMEREIKKHALDTASFTMKYGR